MDPLVVTFITVWVVLGGVGTYLFQFNRNAARKRRLFPWFVGLVGGLMLVFTTAIVGASWQILIFTIPAIVLITYLNIRGTQFCPHCGRTINNHGLIMTRRAYCPYCGAPLDT
jgi:uncharacterized membrane protein YdbT with pleckstrin-like domain